MLLGGGFRTFGLACRRFFGYQGSFGGGGRLGSLVSCLLFTVCLSWSWVARAEVRRFEHESKVLHEVRSLSVYLPPGYDPTLSYPLALLLHGYSENDTFFEQRYQFGAMLDTLIEAGQMTPVIVVMPDASMNRTVSGYTYKGSFYVDSVAGPYEQYILGEVLAWVEARFSVSSEARRRAVLGHSMGGFGAMYYALEHGNKRFGLVASFNAPLLPPFLEHGQAILNQVFTEGSLLSIMTGRVMSLLKLNPESAIAITCLGRGFRVPPDRGLVDYERLRGLKVILTHGRENFGMFEHLHRLLRFELWRRGIAFSYEPHQGDHYSLLGADLQRAFLAWSALLEGQVP